MSHVVTIKTELRSLRSDQGCLQRHLVGAFHANQRTYNWFGHWMGDSPTTC